jgi:sulfur carrier protein ThiS adenylyltransferase
MTEFEREFFQKRDPRVLGALRQSTVGIAGAGGLGSNVAVALARAAVGKLIVADFDILETPDLNRQYYFADQVGRPKVDALHENIRRISPLTDCAMHNIRVTRENLGSIFGSADLLVEAFDVAGEKQMIVEAWLALFPDRPVILGSGIAGYGGNMMLHQRDMGNLYICGDEASECTPEQAPMAPRVAIVAGMQANLAVELLVSRMHAGF